MNVGKQPQDNKDTYEKKTIRNTRSKTNKRTQNVTEDTAKPSVVAFSGRPDDRSTASALTTDTVATTIDSTTRLADW